jgi:hypothetical protein
MAHQRLHGLHVLIVSRQQGRGCVAKRVLVNVLGNACTLTRRRDVVAHNGLRPKWLATMHAWTGEDPIVSVV